MKIRTKLYLSSIISIGLIIGLIITIAQTSLEVAKQNRQRAASRQTLQAISELDILTYEYLLNHEKRPEEQWHLRYDSLNQILTTLMSNAEATEKETISRLIENYSLIGSSFSELVANYQKEQKLIQDGAQPAEINLVAAAENRLTSTLLVTSQAMVSDASSLAEKNVSDMLGAYNLGKNLTLIIGLILLINGGIAVWGVAKIVADSLKTLSKGADAIGGGDLDYRIKIKSNDEIGEAARTFNHMAVNLKTLIISKTGLENEIIQRIIMEEALRRSEKRIASEKEILNVSMENTEAQLAYLDKNFNFVKVNSAYCRARGYEPENLIGKNHFSLFPDEKNQSLFKEVRDTANPVKFLARPFFFKNQLQEGITYWDWTLAPVKNKNNQTEGLVLSLVDVTQGIKSEKILRVHVEELEKMTTELKKLETAVENASDFIFITDPDGKILYMNNAVENLFGYKKDEMLGGNRFLWGHDIIGVPEYLKDKILNTVAGKEVFSGEIENTRKDGTEFISEIRISPIMDKDNQIKFFLGIERDVTQAKEIDRAKSEFLSLAAHQLRTPLASISLSSELLLRGADDKISDDDKKCLEEIFDHAHKMAELIDLFLNVTRIELGRLEISPEKTDVLSLAEDIAKEVLPQIKAKGLNLKKTFTRDLPEIDIDHKVLRIALGNFLSNAIKYTQKGGLIELKVTKTDKDVIFQVSDNGCGIPKKQQPQIFTKMFRASNVTSAGIDGVGLGLYIAKGMIESAGGKISLESEENKGSTFSIAIPLSGMEKKSVKLPGK
jgi:PAS domain S-box-containing protein